MITLILGLLALSVLLSISLAVRLQNLKELLSDLNDRELDMDERYSRLYNDYVSLFDKYHNAQDVVEALTDNEYDKVTARLEKLRIKEEKELALLD